MTIRYPKRFLASIIAICAILFAWRVILASHGVSGLYTYMATDSRLDSIAYGCIGAFLLWRLNIAAAINVRWLKMALPLGLAILLAATAVRSPMFRETARYSLQGIGLLLFVLALFTSWGRPVIYFLELEPMRWMGRM